MHLIQLPLHGAILRAQVYQNNQKEHCDQHTWFLQKIAHVLKHLCPGWRLRDALLDLALVTLERVDEACVGICTILLGSLLVWRGVCAQV